MSIWVNKAGMWINTDNACLMQVVYSQIDNVWYIQYSFDGINWAVDTSDVFTTQIAAQTALNAFAATLG